MYIYERLDIYFTSLSIQLSSKPVQDDSAVGVASDLTMQVALAYRSDVLLMFSLDHDMIKKMIKCGTFEGRSLYFVRTIQKRKIRRPKMDW